MADTQKRDIMNDPAFDPPAASDPPGAAELQTCRICRSEATQEEELFHPCKCSGSIKYVHQECLMEWLSHSQKKHCELCKTPFRFTKLYSPEMPNQLPTSVFLQHLVSFSLRSVVTWLRALLVGFVWLAWLPWSERAAWRFLFWMADGGWIMWQNGTPEFISGSEALDVSRNRLETFRKHGPDAVSLSQGFTASNLTSLKLGPLTVPFASVLKPISQTLNMTASEPVIMRMARKLVEFNRHAVQSGAGFSGSVSANRTGLQNARFSSSLLSDIRCLRELTRSPNFNRVVIDIFEGLMITLTILTTFVLIFLIREWVVQQQPAINLDEAENHAEPAEIGAEAEPLPTTPTQEANPGAPDRAAAERLHANDDPDSPPERPRPLAVPRRRSKSASSANIESTRSGVGSETTLDGQRQRPILPSRDAISRIAEIQRVIEEDGIAEGDDRLLNQRFADGSTPDASDLRQTYESATKDPEARPIFNYEGPEFPVSASASRWRFPEQTSSRPEDDKVSDATQAPWDEWTVPDQQATFGRTPVRGEQVTVDELLERLNARSTGSPSVSEQGSGRAEEEAQDEDPFAHISLTGPAGTGDLGPPGPTSREETETDESGPAESSAPAASLIPNVTVNVPEKSWYEIITNWMWNGIEDAPRPAQQEAHQNDEHIVQDVANEPPFVPVHHEAQQHEEERPAEQAAIAPDAQPANANGEAALDAEAIEEAEEFEGVMELIGMRGPLASLCQNAMFSGILISTSLMLGIWLPYLCGKTVFIMLGHPIAIFVQLPVYLLLAIAETCLDIILFLGGSFLSWSDSIVRLLLTPLASAHPLIQNFTTSSLFGNQTQSIAEGGLNRLANTTVEAIGGFSGIEIPFFSIISHQTLQSLKNIISTLTRGLFDFLIAFGQQGSVWSVLQSIKAWIWWYPDFRALAALTPNAVSSGMSKFTDFQRVELETLDLSLAYWNGWDRACAVLVGYLVFSGLAALYLHRGRPFSSKDQLKAFEMTFMTVLQQAGGVAKVILIISIEMIVFPFYCGLLLDAALLPLFGNSTFDSRVTFTLQSPWTSIFVHWFVGTCYMFHFALFVSMCRKIMRKGVLYFIRDPDDPTFHPVRDVLERNVATQLRKIAFSALVYGALVMVCLGGVVWGLRYAFEGVFPIHWSSNEPVLEYPVDLLFYNFLMPFSVKALKPSEWLHTVYAWWFRKCARMLRLSWFLFGERYVDEEMYNPKKDEKDPKEPVSLRDGRYVRTPASDQVRIPRGGRVFVEVNEFNERIDGEPEVHVGLHGRFSGYFTKVYAPSWFRVRIGLFIFYIWLFAASTGVGITIIPLVLGRYVFSSIFPAGIRTNDVYAFSIGAYALVGLAYGAANYRRGVDWLSAAYRRAVKPDPNSPDHHNLEQAYAFLFKAWTHVSYALSLAYFYTSFAVIMPSLLSIVLELYIIVPAHTYYANALRAEFDREHVIHFIQDWTLGVLYLKSTGRMILWYEDTRPARALRALVRNGWLKPDVGLATRGFILPVFTLIAFALLTPLPLGWLMNAVVDQVQGGKRAIDPAFIYRLSYPALLGTCVALVVLRLSASLVGRWRRSVRDEVYLIGERLHNFGERRASSATTAAATAGSSAGVQFR